MVCKEFSSTPLHLPPSFGSFPRNKTITTSHQVIFRGRWLIFVVSFFFCRQRQWVWAAGISGRESLHCCVQEVRRGHKLTFPETGRYLRYWCVKYLSCSKMTVKSLKPDSDKNRTKILPLFRHQIRFRFFHKRTFNFQPKASWRLKNLQFGIFAIVGELFNCFWQNETDWQIYHFHFVPKIHHFVQIFRTRRGWRVGWGVTCGKCSSALRTRRTRRSASRRSSRRRVRASCTRCTAPWSRSRDTPTPRPASRLNFSAIFSFIFFRPGTVVSVTAWSHVRVAVVESGVLAWSREGEGPSLSSKGVATQRRGSDHVAGKT